ncbi:MAG TPA: glycosyltransferase [Flavobacterium sp.]|nr:glycosyltransferase [Flavobacterium sp.]
MNHSVRILQLIDSLETGGAERMAINYANTLAEVIPLSALVTTRKEGALKEQLSDKVTYLFLNKKGRLGLSAVLRLRKFILQHKINVIHAHSTSFFTAILVKLLYPKVRIVWHDHNGNRVHTKGAMNKTLKWSSLLFWGVLTVNQELEKWSKQNLHTQNTQYFPNFIPTTKSEVMSETFLKGEKGKRIVFLANLRKPKNHLQVLKAFAASQATNLGWTLHLIGNDYSDDYSETLKDFILKNDLQDAIFIYNSRNDIEHILNQANIGILGSTYEGFPVTLLEYGMANLCVLSTQVGYCKDIIQDSKSGLLFSPDNLSEITDKLNCALLSKTDRINYAYALNSFVMDNYTDKVIIDNYLDWLG